MIIKTEKRHTENIETKNNDIKQPLKNHNLGRDVI